jgi:hypothetical protein
MQDDPKVSIPGSRLLVYFVVLITLIIEAAWLAVIGGAIFAATVLTLTSMG